MRLVTKRVSQLNAPHPRAPLQLGEVRVIFDYYSLATIDSHRGRLAEGWVGVDDSCEVVNQI